MLRAERERFRQVGLEVALGLARDPVEEVEREVVEARVSRNVANAPAHRLGPGPPLEHLEECRLEALRAERDAVHAGRTQALRRAPA